MKVIENNYKPLTITCENCGSILSIDPSETSVGFLGQRKLRCPCCGQDTHVEELEDEKVTAQNFIYPDHFYHFYRGYQPRPSEIEKCLRNGIQYLQKNLDEEYINISLGSALMMVFRGEDEHEFHLVVAESYYDIEVSEE